MLCLLHLLNILICEESGRTFMCGSVIYVYGMAK